ncbi:MAG: hypothetical protein HeimAB125_05080 [Candidatus Heimdallarchaeota archaeon AB_125]|nr:MAG: hypothetical protein HeimAB125_05080 [Candidatus Heimdallarchaeota archaeon AB_125]
MDTTKTSILDEIALKLREYIDMSYWAGRGNRQSFREDVKKLVSEEKLTKDEYNYLLKNERRVLVKTQLIHLIPELQSQEVFENTLKHLSNVVFGKKYKEAETKKGELENQIIRQIAQHLDSTLHPQISSVNDGFGLIKHLITESPDISKELLKISNQLIEIRDALLEKGYSPMLIREIEQLSTKLVFASKSTNPEDIPSKEEVLNMLNEIQISAGVE